MLLGCRGDERVLDGAARDASLGQIEQELAIGRGAEPQEGFRKTFPQEVPN
jgi:hypothetical protein